MVRTILIDELHLVVTVPLNLNEAASGNIRRTLGSKRFQVDLHRCVRRVFRRYSTLRRTHVVMTR